METTQNDEGKRVIFNPQGKRKYYFSLLTYLIVLAAIPVSVYLVRQRQEIRKGAVDEFECQDDWSGCRDFQSCVQKNPVSEDFAISCEQFPDLLILGRPNKICFANASGQNMHQLTTVVSKDPAYRGREVEFDYVADFYHCEEPCGVKIRGGQDLIPNWCACLDNKQVKRSSVKLGASIQSEKITEVMPLFYGECGSAEIDIWVESIRVDGVKGLGCNKGPVWSLWFSNQTLSECQ